MNDMQKFTCPILWSTKLKPKDVERVLLEERIQKLLERGLLPVALFPFDVKKFMAHHGVIDPSQPMGWIYGISIEDGKYVAHIAVPEPYVPHYKCIYDPVVLPIIMGKPEYPEGWRIISMHVYERNQLNEDNSYGGVNYPDEAQTGESKSDQQEIWRVQNMYESPIQQIVGQMQTEMESELMYRVSQSVGYNIDKDELVKALKYDRGQYEKGYADGLAKERWINVNDQTPVGCVDVLVYRRVGTMDRGVYTNDKWYIYCGMCEIDDVEWWQPITIPEAVRRENNE